MTTNFSVSSRQGLKLWGLSPWLPSLAWASQLGLEMLINLRGDKGSTIQYTALTLKWPGLVYKVFCLLIIFQKCSYIIMGAWCCWLPDPDNVSCRLQLPSGAPPPRRALRHENIFIILYLFISRSKRMFRIFYPDTLSESLDIKIKKHKIDM